MKQIKAVIELDVPEWQIGQPVTVYFKDTMCKRGVCEAASDDEVFDKQWNKMHVSWQCTRCFQTVKRDDKFCNYCGAKLKCDEEWM